MSRTTAFDANATANIGWRGNLRYRTRSSSGSAGYGYFAPGCAGPLGITHLVHDAPPRLGTTMTVSLDNLPVSAALMMTGLSRTLSNFGLLPLDLGPFGAPSCFGRVGPDAIQFLIGTGNLAQWHFGVPNSTGLIGVQIYNQALVLAPGTNALGAVASDAAAMLIGN